MSKTIVIDSDIQKQTCYDLIKGLEVGRKYCVIIADYDMQRTKDQNALIWKLAQHFADNTEHFGRIMGKTNWYYSFSLMFLDPILGVDFRDGTVKEIAQGMSKLSKKQFTWVIDKIYEFAREWDFPLPHPEDLKYDR